MTNVYQCIKYEYGFYDWYLSKEYESNKLIFSKDIERKPFFEPEKGPKFP